MENLRSLILGLVTPEQFCQHYKITMRTFHRWNRNPEKIPGYVHDWLSIKRGDLSDINPNWSGWFINHRTGELVAPSGLAVTYSQIEHMSMAFNERDLLRRDNRLLRKKIGKSKNTPVPGTAKILKFPRI